jgi:acylphosphatase
VWYRDSTREQAQRLGISGSARNLDDGRVEVLACGSEMALDDLQKWLWQGPSQAHVNSVQAEVIPYRKITGFEVR